MLADAGHVLTDVAGLALALAAVWAAGRPANDARTFGYARLEVFAAVANAVLLLAIAVFVLFEAVQRLSEPYVVRSGLMLVVATIGLVANGVSLLLLRHGQRESLNLRGAYLEVLGDLAGSLAVIAAAVVIAVTGWTGADVVASVAIGLLILPRTLALFRESMSVLLEGTPNGVDMDHVRRHILEAPGVVDCHDLHAWTITSGLHVVSAHVVLAKGADPAVALEAGLRRVRSPDDSLDIESTRVLARRPRSPAAGHRPSRSGAVGTGQRWPLPVVHDLHSPVGSAPRRVGIDPNPPLWSLARPLAGADSP